jgi:hypothetical protein
VFKKVKNGLEKLTGCDDFRKNNLARGFCYENSAYLTIETKTRGMKRKLGEMT